ncbi:MAG TPA: cohesin domain-containing protein, partial [Bacteroidota bacterium]|nr:cohesin domain-containing protein [Bacteroidota bacterium]
TYLKGLGISPWVFVDSANVATVEHSSDSVAAWSKAEKSTISYTLVGKRKNQDFYGALRGDVDFSYGASQDVNTMPKIANASTANQKNALQKGTAANPVVFSTSSTLGARPGDTVLIPLNIKPGDAGIDGFNASLQVDPKILTYTGQYQAGQAMPQKANWYIAAKSDASGKLNIAALDFSIVTPNPVMQSGTVIAFKFAVNSTVALGASSTIGINATMVLDPQAHRLSSQTTNGEIEFSSSGVAIPKDYELSQNYPNPFNPSTTIKFSLPMDSKVDLIIYNILGQKVATLVSETLSAGYHNVVWNASNMSSGIYFSVLKSTSLSNGKDFKSVKKLMLLK